MEVALAFYPIDFQIRDFGIDKIQITGIKRSGNLFDADLCDAFFNEIKFLGGRFRHVDDPFSFPGTTVRNANHHALHVFQIRDSQECPKRIGTMGGNELVFGLVDTFIRTKELPLAGEPRVLDAPREEKSLRLGSPEETLALFREDK